jgi:hypothetical protein
MPIADPLFILAPPRCFTTVVSAMLGQHPQMYGLPETYLFTCDTVAAWFEANAGSDRVHGLLRAIAQINSGEQTISSIEMARRWLRSRSAASTREVFECLAERVHPRALVEKTPKVAEQSRSMTRIDASFPRARFIHLVRHPLAHARSRLERRLKQNGGGPAQRHDLVTVAEQLGADPQMLWYRSNVNILDFLATVPGHRQRLVRGEDLLREPDMHLKAIAQWLGIRTDRRAIEAMKHPEASPFSGFGPRNAPMGGDEKFFRAPRLRPPRLAQQMLGSPVPWRSDDAWLRPSVQGLAQRLGYT